jgi:hypothetical protein
MPLAGLAAPFAGRCPSRGPELRSLGPGSGGMVPWFTQIPLWALLITGTPTLLMSTALRTRGKHS